MSNKIFIAILFGATTLVTGCNTQNEASENALIFPKGEKITNNNFTGNAWLQPLIAADSMNQNSVGNVTFEPGARSN